MINKEMAAVIHNEQMPLIRFTEFINISTAVERVQGLYTVMITVFRGTIDPTFFS